MAFTDLDKVINVGGTTGGIGGENDPYKYPASPKLIAFNVPPYDNDGEQSVQKWVTALDGAYHPYANSNDAAYVASVVEGSGALSIKSKTYPYGSNIAKIVNGEVKYGVYIDSVSLLTTTDNYLLNEFSKRYVSSSSVLAAQNNSRINVSKKGDGKSLGNAYISSIVNKGDTVNIASGQFGVLDNGRDIFIAEATGRTFSPASCHGVVSAIIELTTGELVTVSVSALNNTQATITTTVNEDTNYVYVSAVTGTQTDNKRIHKTTGVINSVAPAGTAITLTNLSTLTDLGDDYNSLSGTDGVGYNYKTAGAIKPTDFVNNGFSADVEINGTVVDTITVAADGPVVTNGTVSLSDVTIGATSVTLDLVTDATHLGYSKYGFGLTGGDYTAPTGTNDASGDATSGRDVGGDGMYLNLELEA